MGKKDGLTDPQGWAKRMCEQHRQKMLLRYNKLPRNAWRTTVVGHPYNDATELYPWELHSHGGRTYTPFLFRFVQAAVAAGFTAKTVLRLIGFSSSVHGAVVKKWDNWIEGCGLTRIEPTGEGPEIDRIIEALIIKAAPDGAVDMEELLK